MLKIKSNTNEFTIIFFWEDSKENKCWKIICPALIFLFLSASHTSFSFLFPGQPPLFFFSFLPAFFFFSLGVLPFIFQPKIPFFSAQTFFSFSAQKHFFQPKTFLLQPKTFLSSAQNFFFFFFFSSAATLLFFFFLLYSFLVQPSLFSFSATFFSFL